MGRSVMRLLQPDPPSPCGCRPARCRWPRSQTCSSTPPVVACPPIPTPAQPVANAGSSTLQDTNPPVGTERFTGGPMNVCGNRYLKLQNKWPFSIQNHRFSGAIISTLSEFPIETFEEVGISARAFAPADPPRHPSEGRKGRRTQHALRPSSSSHPHSSGRESFIV